MADAGNSDTPPPSSSSGGERERAEEVVADVSRRVSRFVTTAAARVREEAEDIWAEAQSIRRGEST